MRDYVLGFKSTMSVFLRGLLFLDLAWYYFTFSAQLGFKLYSN